MAHNHAYLICESKCLVEGVPKSTYDTRQTEINEELNGKASSTHTHTKSEISDFEHEHTKSEISDFEHEHTKSEISDFAHTHVKNQISDFAHNHSKSEITDFSHNHAISEITNLQSELDSLKKQCYYVGSMDGSAITTADETALKTALNTFDSATGHPKEGDLVNVSGGYYNNQQWYRNSTTWQFFSSVAIPVGVRVIHVSTEEPTSAEGNDGDLWFVYE